MLRFIDLPIKVNYDFQKTKLELKLESTSFIGAEFEGPKCKNARSRYDFVY